MQVACVVPEDPLELEAPELPDEEEDDEDPLDDPVPPEAPGGPDDDAGEPDDAEQATTLTPRPSATARIERARGNDDGTGRGERLRVLMSAPDCKPCAVSDTRKTPGEDGR
jgi:hypothetical protein